MSDELVYVHLGLGGQPIPYLRQGTAAPDSRAAGEPSLAAELGQPAGGQHRFGGVERHRAEVLGVARWRRTEMSPARV